jgi:hypothetical protein
MRKTSVAILSVLAAIGALACLDRIMTSPAISQAFPGVDRIVNALNAGLTFGQKTMSASRPIAIASDQSAVPVNLTHWAKSKTVGLTTTVVTLFGTAKDIGFIDCDNQNNAFTYVQLFDTTGAVTLGSTSPDMFIPIPPASAGWVNSSNGITFANGIKLAATTTPTGSTAPATTINCFWGTK